MTPPLAASAVRTPLHTGVALALGQTRFRKEVLIRGPLHVDGRTFDVTDGYLDAVKAAFDAGAIKSPPVQLAPDDNSHTEDLSRRRGTVVALHRTARGLDADVELNDEAAAMMRDYPDTGVSVLIKHDRTTGEGAQHPAALAHLLLTADPVLTTLGPWAEQIAASHDGPTLDLLALSTSAAPDPSTPKDDPDPSEEDVMPTLADLLSNASEDELRELRSKLDDLTPDDLTATAETGEAGDPAGDEVTDAELDEALAALDDDPTTEPTTGPTEDEASDPAEEPVAAAHTAGDDALALANAQMTEQLTALRTSQAQMQTRLNDADWNERQAAYAKAGVPRLLVDRARPALHGNDTTLALSQADRDKTAKLVDGLLLETGKLLTALGLSQGTVGTIVDTPADQAEAEQRDAAVSKRLADAGLTRS